MTDSQVRDGPATTRLHVVCNLASMAMPVTLLAIASFSIQFESSLRGVILAVMAVVSLLYIAMMVRVVRQHGFIRINPIDLYLPVLSAIELFILVKHNGNHMFPSPLTLYATLIAFTLFLAFLIARRQSRVQPTAATMESS